MPHNLGDDIPIRRAGFSIRSPWAVAVLMPFYLPVTLAIFIVSVVFTLWPDVLEHSPISFETLGFWHHVWHYSLMLGSALILVGLFWVSVRRLTVELIGLSVLTGAMTTNIIALTAFAFASGDGEDPSGLGLAIRAGVIAGLAVRAYVIVAEPIVTITAPKEG